MHSGLEVVSEGEEGGGKNEQSKPTVVGRLQMCSQGSRSFEAESLGLFWVSIAVG